jgi:hypothetical protein
VGASGTILGQAGGPPARRRLTEIMTILAAIMTRPATIHGKILLARSWEVGREGFASEPTNRRFFGFGLQYAVTRGLSSKPIDHRGTRKHIYGLPVSRKQRYTEGSA